MTTAELYHPKVAGIAASEREGEWIATEKGLDELQTLAYAEGIRDQRKTTDEKVKAILRELALGL